MNITSAHLDRQILKIVCFGGGPVLLACAVVFVRQLGLDAGQSVTAIFSAAAMALGIVTLGIVGTRS